MQMRSQPAGGFSTHVGVGTRPPSRLTRFNALDSRRVLNLLQRLLTGDLSVISEVVDNESDTRPAIAAMLLGVFASAVGAWLWVAIDTSGGAVVEASWRVLLLGSIATLGAWGLWLGLTWHALSSIFNVDLTLRPLLRAMALTGGFAVWQFFMLAGPASFAIGLVGAIASVLLAVLAVRAAAPAADDRAALVSVGVGFAVYALVLSLIADLAGVGSGLFVHAIG